MPGAVKLACISPFPEKWPSSFISIELFELRRQDLPLVEIADSGCDAEIIIRIQFYRIRNDIEIRIDGFLEDLARFRELEPAIHLCIDERAVERYHFSGIRYGSSEADGIDGEARGAVYQQGAGDVKIAIQAVWIGGFEIANELSAVNDIPVGKVKFCGFAGYRS